uniref:Uncharacterized protein n=1 Tax=Moniliophthora roreri TaxID=221103 RepID=A0A0W0FTF6_MONRR
MALRSTDLTRQDALDHAVT